MKQMEADILESIEETESYVWGLAIAGIFHLWEKTARRLATRLLNRPKRHYERAGIREICAIISETGYKIEDSRHFQALEICGLIANTVKHGEGPASRRLIIERPDLFVSRGAEGLRVWQGDFDYAATAIDKIWGEYEAAYARNSN